MKVLFGTQNYQYLVNELFHGYPNKYKKGKLECKKFLDGESYYRFDVKDINNQDIIFVAGTASNDDVVELFDLCSAIVKYGAKSLTILCPYYGWSTMERTVKEGEVVTAKTRARLISAIPQAKEGNKIILFDLHSEGIPYYFEGNVVAKHVYGKELVKDIIFNEIKADKKFILASTDAGRAKWVSSLGNDFGLDTAFVYKKRSDNGDILLEGINADVKDRNIIIYDDMIRSGSSLINAAKAYKDAGANDLYVITTHGLFVSGEKAGKTYDSAENLATCGLFKQIYCSNSHYKTNDLNDQYVKVRSIIKYIEHCLK